MNTVLSRELAPEELKALGPNRLLVRVRSIIYEGDDINSYEVVDPAGGELPPFTAGSHIDLYFRDQRIRQYSLCNNPNERHRYVFTVQRDLMGRGGSKAIFERVHPGRILTISEPRNNFPLHPEASKHLFVAGGIGVTPIMSMIHALFAKGADFTLHYCTRSPQKTAFADQLSSLKKEGKAFFYHDGGDPSKGLDLVALLRDYSPGTHLYYCGPAGFMNAVHNASAHWPSGTTHFEYFTPPVNEAVPQMPSSGTPADTMEGSISVGFQVELASTGETFDVPDDKSIAQVLREHGVEVQTSCEAGVCGTCRTRYLSGAPDHRDYILSDEEKEKEILICCSRSKLPLLVLDL